MSALSYAIPLAASKILMPDGTMSRDWYLFLSALLQTVGGPAVVPGGGISPMDVHQQFEEYPVSNIEAQEALRGIDELRNARESQSDTRTDDLVRQVDELRNELASTRADTQYLRGMIEELISATQPPPQQDLRNRIESIEDRLA